jgi:hypothetical protein
MEIIVSLYPKPPKESLIDVIRASNPNLPLPLTADMVTFGEPKAIPLVSGSSNNTEIVMSARGLSGYVNKTTVKYRRLDLATLFRGLSAEVYKYTAAGPYNYPFDIYGLLKEINKRFGLNLTEDDVANSWFPWENDKYYPDRRSSQAALAAKPNSLMYVGKTVLRWVSDRKSIADMILKTEIPGRFFPDGKSAIPTKYVLDCATYDADFGEFSKDMAHGWLTGFPFGYADPNVRRIHDEVLSGINRVTGETYTYDTPPEPFGLGGIVPVRYTLPNVAIPEANSTDFNSVIVFPYPVNGVWGVGRLLLHYNT